jgi:hypothetical protein
MSIREHLLDGLLCAAESAADLVKSFAVSTKLPSQFDIDLAGQRLILAHSGTEATTSHLQAQFASAILPK